jgi:hypothetical protein
MAAWNALFDQARAAFAQQRSFERARTFGVSALTCLGRRTLSGLLCASGQQCNDWSAAYRLFERERLDGQELWRVPLSGVLENLPPASPIVALIDDTLLRKRGHRIAGTSWRRDPLGPHFADNFIWASRFLQISLALPEHPEALVSAARAIPVDLLHAPSPRKPPRRADPAGPEWQSWRAASAASAISRRGAERTFFVFVYALLLLALENCHLTHSPLPRPRWQRLRPHRPHPRITTSQAISVFRADLWASALSLQNKSGFAALDRRATKPLLIQNNLQSAVLYASG